MAEFDLTHTVSKFLDRHMLIPLLEFLQQKDLYEEKDILEAKMELLNGTNMVDFAAETFQQVNPGKDVPAEMTEKRGAVVSRLKQLSKESAPIVELFQNEEVLNQINTTRDGQALVNYLQQNHGYKPEMAETLYEYAKFQFDCGNYSVASEYLYHYRVLSMDAKKNVQALWGKFVADILDQDWEEAQKDLTALKDIIDGKNPASHVEKLQQRTWLIHWSLFVFFNHAEGLDGIIDMFLYDDAYANAIQTVCPHILRYLTTAVITNKRRRNVLKDLVKVIQQEAYSYRDPITEFLECLYVNFDFDSAQTKLRECETVLSNDFFLVACREDFIENARLFIFETYCRIHNTISISMLAEKLNMTPDKAEQWIVNLIRNARLDAKIDSQAGHVKMATQVPSIYHQVIEKTKNLGFRSNMLKENVDKKGGGGGKRGGGKRQAKYEM